MVIVIIHSNYRTMRDEYEDLRLTHIMCCDSANSLADKTTDPSVSEQLHPTVTRGIAEAGGSSY